jgi:predicted nucleic-acid-binding Zn-ribbon protein
MTNIRKTLKRAAKAFKDSMGPGQYTAGGKVVLCPHCEGNTFVEGSAQLNTSGMTFLNLDWANKSATTLACTNCGRIQWFIKRPERLERVNY